MTDLLLSPLALTLYTILVIIGVLMTGVAIMTWIERRLSGVIQFRWGPNRVGPAGLFQPAADGVKFIMKEDVIPRDAFRPIFVIAPGLAMITALCAFAVIPFGPTIELFGRTIPLVIVNVDGGILFALAAASLGVYGIVCAGWSSNSKYSLMGGLRASAQMISYELPLALAVIGVLLISGTLRPVEIVEQQAGWFWNWNVFGGWQLLGFLIFLVAGYAETNRLPFDMPEAESELVAGYHTEYSSMKFSMFFMAEYVNMITSAALAVVLFLGGYNTGLPLAEWGLSGWTLWIVQILAFVGKVGFFMILFVWVRWTLPRFRYDQLMALGWKRLFPLALANLMFAAVLVAFDVIG
ncbi:MAG: NADH-quinone oxidoreductase subunit NuoH [Planctomycetota bacterium]